MCRLTALLSAGDQPYLLADILTRPRMSIIRQSFCCQERLGACGGTSPSPRWAYEVNTLNADGFGVGWYSRSASSGVTPRPCVFTSLKPAWSDRNLANLAEHTASHLIFAHVRAAGAGSGWPSETNCHPFHYGRFLFMHNGEIGDWPRVRARFLQLMAPPVLPYLIESGGFIDSLALFGLVLSQLDRGPWSHYTPNELRIILERALVITAEVCAEEGVSSVSLLNVVLTDGACVVAARHVVPAAATDGAAGGAAGETAPEAASLYFASGTRWTLADDADNYHMVHSNKRTQVAIVTSEPLTDCEEEWVPVPQNHIVIITRNVDVLLCAVASPGRAIKQFVADLERRSAYLLALADSAGHATVSAELAARGKDVVEDGDQGYNEGHTSDEGQVSQLSLDRFVASQWEPEPHAGPIGEPGAARRRTRSPAADLPRSMARSVALSTDDQPLSITTGGQVYPFWVPPLLSVAAETTAVLSKYPALRAAVAAVAILGGSAPSCHERGDLERWRERSLESFLTGSRGGRHTPVPSGAKALSDRPTPAAAFSITKSLDLLTEEVGPAGSIPELATATTSDAVLCDDLACESVLSCCRRRLSSADVPLPRAPQPLPALPAVPPVKYFFPTQPSPVLSVATFSVTDLDPGGSTRHYAVTGCQDGSLAIWDVDAGLPLRALSTANSGSVLCLMLLHVSLCGAPRAGDAARDLSRENEQTKDSSRTDHLGEELLLLLAGVSDTTLAVFDLSDFLTVKKPVTLAHRALTTPSLPRLPELLITFLPVQGDVLSLACHGAGATAVPRSADAPDPALPGGENVDIYVGFQNTLIARIPLGDVLAAFERNAGPGPAAPLDAPRCKSLKCVVLGARISTRKQTQLLPLPQALRDLLLTAHSTPLPDAPTGRHSVADKSGGGGSFNAAQCDCNGTGPHASVRALSDRAICAGKCLSSPDENVLEAYKPDVLFAHALVYTAAARHCGFVESIVSCGHWLLSGGGDGLLLVWDQHARVSARTLCGHTGGILCLLASVEPSTGPGPPQLSDGPPAHSYWVFSGSRDKTICVWSLDTLSCRHTLRSHSSDVLCLALADSHWGACQFLLSGSANGELFCWDRRHYYLLRRLDPGHAIPTYSPTVPSFEFESPTATFSRQATSMANSAAVGSSNAITSLGVLPHAGAVRGLLAAQLFAQRTLSSGTVSMARTFGVVGDPDALRPAASLDVVERLHSDDEVASDQEDGPHVDAAHRNGAPECVVVQIYSRSVHSSKILATCSQNAAGCAAFRTQLMGNGEEPLISCSFGTPAAAPAAAGLLAPASESSDDAPVDKCCGGALTSASPAPCPSSPKTHMTEALYKSCSSVTASYYYGQETPEAAAAAGAVEIVAASGDGILRLYRLDQLPRLMHADFEDEFSTFRSAEASPAAGTGFTFEECLKDMVAFRSVSGDPAYLDHSWRAARYLVRLLARIGASARLVNIGTGRNPLVLGRLGHDKSKPTVLMYSHYDVVPASTTGSRQCWTMPPWNLTILNGYYHGRGVTDNKAPALAQIFAALPRSTQDRSTGPGPLPVNLVWLCEGEEEQNSAGFEDAVRKLYFAKDGSGDALQDVSCVVCTNSYWADDHRPCLVVGMRGVVDLTFSVRSGREAVGYHSGLHGGAVAETLQDVVALAAALAPKDGRIPVPGIYDGVNSALRLDPSVVADAAPDGRERYRAELKGAALTPGSELELLRKRWLEPALSLSEVWSSNQRANVGLGEAFRVVPSRASCNVSVRLVPDQDPQRVANAVHAYLKQEFAARNSGNELEVRTVRASPPWSAADSTGSAAAYRAALWAVKRAWSVQPAVVREGGTMPVLRFLQDFFRVQVVHLPLGQASDAAHLPNEKIRVLNVKKGVETLRLFFGRYAALAARAAAPAAAGAAGRQTEPRVH